MATARLSQGTTIVVDDGLGVDIAIGGVSNIALSDGEAETIIVSDLDSTAVEKLQGLPDFGACTIEFSKRDLDDVGQAELLAIKLAQESREFTITRPAGTLTTGVFTGVVTTMPISFGVNEAESGNCTIEISGTVVWS